VSCQAPISLDWAWIPIDRGQTPHLFWQSLKPQPQLGETLQGGRQRGPPRAAAQCEIGTPPESTTQRAARRCPSLVEYEQFEHPADPTSGDAQSNQARSCSGNGQGRSPGGRRLPITRRGEAALAPRSTRPPMAFANVASRALFCRSNRRGQATAFVGCLATAQWRRHGSPGLVATPRLANTVFAVTAWAAETRSFFPPQRRAPRGPPRGAAPGQQGSSSLEQGREDASQPCG